MRASFTRSKRSLQHYRCFPIRSRLSNFYLLEHITMFTHQRQIIHDYAHLWKLTLRLVDFKNYTTHHELSTMLRHVLPNSRGNEEYELADSARQQTPSHSKVSIAFAHKRKIFIHNNKLLLSLSCYVSLCLAKVGQLHKNTWKSMKSENISK